nr:hypothetical protein CFP56_77849 [Quercus suber]
MEGHHFFLILRNSELSYEQRSGAINKKEEQLEQEALSKTTYAATSNGVLEVPVLSQWTGNKLPSLRFAPQKEESVSDSMLLLNGENPIPSFLGEELRILSTGPIRCQKAELLFSQSSEGLLTTCSRPAWLLLSQFKFQFLFLNWVQARKALGVDLNPDDWGRDLTYRPFLVSKQQARQNLSFFRLESE